MFFTLKVVKSETKLIISRLLPRFGLNPWCIKPLARRLQCTCQCQKHVKYTPLLPPQGWLLIKKAIALTRFLFFHQMSSYDCKIFCYLFLLIGGSFCTLEWSLNGVRSKLTCHVTILTRFCTLPRKKWQKFNFNKITLSCRSVWNSKCFKSCLRW